MAMTSRDKRALMILGGVAGVAVVFYLLTSVLGGGGGDEAAEPPPTVTTAPQPVPSPTPSPTPRETLPPVVMAGDRDPFSIPPTLQSPGGGVSPTGAPTIPGTSPTQAPTQSPTQGPTQGPTQAPTAPGSGASATIGGHIVVLLDVFDNGTKAQIEVDGTVYTVDEGSRFDDNFRLNSIQGGCANIVYGDESFTLCVNAPK
jgi:hypothetical protein